jgi:hypothetical protein
MSVRGHGSYSQLDVVDLTYGCGGTFATELIAVGQNTNGLTSSETNIGLVLYRSASCPK